MSHLDPLVPRVVRRILGKEKNKGHQTDDSETENYGLPWNRNMSAAWGELAKNSSQ